MAAELSAEEEQVGTGRAEQHPRPCCEHPGGGRLFSPCIHAAFVDAAQPLGSPVCPLSAPSALPVCACPPTHPHSFPLRSPLLIISIPAPGLPRALPRRRYGAAPPVPVGLRGAVWGCVHALPTPRASRDVPASSPAVRHRRRMLLGSGAGLAAEHRPGMCGWEGGLSQCWGIWDAAVTQCLAFFPDISPPARFLSRGWGVFHGKLHFGAQLVPAHLTSVRNISPSASLARRPCYTTQLSPIKLPLGSLGDANGNALPSCRPPSSSWKRSTSGQASTMCPRSPGTWPSSSSWPASSTSCEPLSSSTPTGYVGGARGVTRPPVSLRVVLGGHAMSLPQETRLKEGIVKLKPHEEPLRSELLSGKFTILVGARCDAAPRGAACGHAVTSLSPTERSGPLGGLHRPVHSQAAPPQSQRAARGAPGALLPAGQGRGEVSRAQCSSTALCSGCCFVAACRPSSVSSVEVAYKQPLALCLHAKD